MAISPLQLVIPSQTTNSPVPLAVCMLHACKLRGKQPPRGNTFKMTPSGEIVYKSAPNREICDHTHEIGSI